MTEGAPRRAQVGVFTNDEAAYEGLSQRQLAAIAEYARLPEISPYEVCAPFQPPRETTRSAGTKEATSRAGLRARSAGCGPLTVRAGTRAQEGRDDDAADQIRGGPEASPGGGARSPLPAGCNDGGALLEWDTPQRAAPRAAGAGSGGGACGGGDAAAGAGGGDPLALPPPLPFRTDWTRLVPPPVLTGHVSSLGDPLAGGFGADAGLEAAAAAEAEAEARGAGRQHGDVRSWMGVR